MLMTLTKRQPFLLGSFHRTQKNPQSCLEAFRKHGMDLLRLLHNRTSCRERSYLQIKLVYSLLVLSTLVIRYLLRQSQPWDCDSLIR